MTEDDGKAEALAKVFKDTVSMIIKAEKTTTGRVNTIGIVVVGFAAVYGRDIFSPNGVVLIAAFVISALVSDYASKSKQRRRRYARRV